MSFPFFFSSKKKSKNQEKNNGGMGTNRKGGERSGEIKGPHKMEKSNEALRLGGGE